MLTQRERNGKAATVRRELDEIWLILNSFGVFARRALT
jgi:hypothetical protein